ncbi:hypothetical protein COT44_02430 [Candidatus Shapirobacteria bacterium CG08_land_8_20_14_0_20_39_18]|uniref:DUF192 domain-containing protein n=1 Tax=Candidatus Shapirobacteria bacterium CG08_land_8_20_14_0_20_39_18 TaxID=1974883 RepID=A0A2M6XDC9_9BACT|nr:MAG: hypothetical protein COT44_02430 [Candidatus Shapirobacteria bacterium CG08_land_8_20_14_0_20_39_18]PIY66163.1 MAG: hypothetical protein COY91_01700 [Candidatus Shapirobacteria bacterium CG_4_10_14_0_8_um_filter_39_15]PJE68865.1 MAG: hypothetical protein COU94_00170 [Candidatus Shapirobacteria bacterium CG10_big_fil_rev_8_21_14_0_10_38_8]
MRNKILLGFLGSLGLLGILIMHKDQEENSLIINNNKIEVEIADNLVSRARGLSGRNKLENNQGMLFIYEKPGIYTFWMNLMKFNLDFVYINGNHVVDFIEDVPYPKTGELPKIVNAKTEFDKVLEVNSGMIRRIGIKIGDLVTIKTE